MSENMKIINEIVCGVMDTEMWGKIEDAICEVGSAYTDAAFLYGMHIAQALQAATANPFEYSAYVLDLAKGRRAAV